MHKQSGSKQTDKVSYHQTYGMPLPSTSINIMTNIVSAFTGTPTAIDRDTRSLYTIGRWLEGTNTVYHCCFIQPEISSMTCSMKPAYTRIASITLNNVREILPDAIPCTLNVRNKNPQLSGRMVPYVVEQFDFDVTWGFANISGSYILFIRTNDIDGQRLLRISLESMNILKHYFPSYSICILDTKTNSYKITVTPDSSFNMDEPNKNTCMYISGDGSFRLQGKPSAMVKVCQSFREAIHAVSSSPSWNKFSDELIIVDQD